jgi:glucosamine--fructose-6-phosphate aminotransferase (isomerizing)
MSTRSPESSETQLAAEIGEQPAIVAALLRDQREAIADAAAQARAADVRTVLIAARGTSDNVARYAQHLLGRFCGLPVALATPSLSTLYGAGPQLERTLVIGISQSGQSPDVRAVIEDAAAQGQLTVAVTNDASSPLARAASARIEIHAGEERSVAATKTYTASLAAVAALTAELAAEDRLRRELAGIASAMEEQIARGAGVEAEAEALQGIQHLAVVGRGPNYATAFEGALKIKELTAIAAEPYSPADLMHGPIAALGPESLLIAIAVEGPALVSVLAAAEEAGRRGARCVLLSDDPRRNAGGLALVAVPEWLSPLVAILPLQALAAQVAALRGVDVDAPFGLTKVTRTT